MEANYITSALKPEQLPVYTLPEYAFIGRSNCGKSTLLNNLLERRNLARASRTPGRTQLINFFGVSDRWIFADLPGYGFNVAHSDVRQHWQALMDGYFKRPNIKALLFLLDSRREANAEDIALMLQLGQVHPLTVVLTKADKLPKSAVPALLKKYAELLTERAIPHEHICVVSSLKGTGVKELRQRLIRS